MTENEFNGLNDKLNIDIDYAREFIKPRKKDIDKRDCGNILVIAGHGEMAGAAVLTAAGALRSGAGLVKVSTSRVNFHVIQNLAPEAICIPNMCALKNIRRYDAIAIGPGMGETKHTGHLLMKLLRQYDKTIVVDADAINVLADSYHLKTAMKKTQAKVVLTPHLREAERLLKKKFNAFDRIDIVKEISEEFNAIALLKGHETLVCDDEGNISVNTTGNPGMATPGSGDVLTGIITSFAGQGMRADVATRLGAFIHGIAGDMAKEELGEYGMLAGDIVRRIPFAIMKVLNQ